MLCSCVVSLFGCAKVFPILSTLGSGRYRRRNSGSIHLVGLCCHALRWLRLAQRVRAAVKACNRRLVCSAQLLWRSSGRAHVIGLRVCDGTGLRVGEPQSTRPHRYRSNDCVATMHARHRCQSCVGRPLGVDRPLPKCRRCRSHVDSRYPARHG